jgi:hypothetical protein
MDKRCVRVGVMSRTMDGHPASSKFDLFEAFVQNILSLAQSNPEQWKETAIVVTVDNWGLAKLSDRSRDNLLNPRASREDPMFLPICLMFDFDRDFDRSGAEASDAEASS